MKRDPVLHIKRSDLIAVMQNIKYSHRTLPAKFADMILKEAQPYQLTDRYLKLLELKTPTKKKVVKSMAADDVPYATVEKVNMMILNYRQKQSPHAKVKPIMKTSKQFLTLKEVTKIAVDFADHFDITPKIDGIREFIEMGIGFMGRYALNRFKTYETKIYEAFESKVAVLTDKKQEDTRQFYGIWQELMLEYSGVEDLINIDRDLVKYSHILYGRIEADKNKADYRTWIEAQFEGLAFLDVIPEVYQFYGDGAKNRYEKYKTSKLSSKQDDSKDIVNIYKNNEDYE